MEKQRITVAHLPKNEQDRIVGNRIREVQRKLQIQRKLTHPSREQLALRRAQSSQERTDRGEERWVQNVTGLECIVTAHGSVLWRPERVGPRKLGSCRRHKKWGKK